MKAVLPDDLRDILGKAGASLGLWHKHLKAGDWVVLLFSGALVVSLYMLLWRGDMADRAIVKRDGKTIIEISLNSAGKTRVGGPLGTTVIEVQPGRARIFSDPGPRQYCVQQGWLTRAGAVAICAPNHITLQLNGRNTDYDSLNY